VPPSAVAIGERLRPLLGRPDRGRPVPPAPPHCSRRNRRLDTQHVNRNRGSRVSLGVLEHRRRPGGAREASLGNHALTDTRCLRPDPAGPSSSPLRCYTSRWARAFSRAPRRRDPRGISRRKACEPTRSLRQSPSRGGRVNRPRTHAPAPVGRRRRERAARLEERWPAGLRSARWLHPRGL
jgi:hypothetical protein